MLHRLCVHVNYSVRKEPLTRPSLLSLSDALHVGVNRNHSHVVERVGVQVPQGGGGGAARHLLLLHTETSVSRRTTPCADPETDWVGSYH